MPQTIFVNLPVANLNRSTRFYEALGFMYGRSFEEPDGHIWEPGWMDPVAIEGGPRAHASA